MRWFMKTPRTREILLGKTIIVKFFREINGDKPILSEDMFSFASVDIWHR